METGEIATFFPIWQKNYFEKKIFLNHKRIAIVLRPEKIASAKALWHKETKNI